MNAKQLDGKHLSNAVTVHHGAVGAEKTVTVSLLEVQTQRAALAHLTPEEARQVAGSLLEAAEFVDGGPKAEPADGETVQRRG